MNMHKHTKHAIIGMGKTGISIAHFLLHQGQMCKAFDEKLKSIPSTLSLPFVPGKLNADSLLDFDAVWVSPGICWSHPALQAARDAGIPVQGDLALFAEHCHTPIIAITGTNGKTTTTQTAQVLMETLPGGCDMGGNIGMPMLDLLKEHVMPSKVILELSSFQLERCNFIHPRWAVLLNIQPDHADMHANEDDYRAAKLRIFEHQSQGDTAMLPMHTVWNNLHHDLMQRGVGVHRFGHVREDNPHAEGLAAGIMEHHNHAKLFWHQDGHRQCIDCEDIPVRGLHQHINLAVAAQAAADFGVSYHVIREALTSFRGLPHRLRLLGHIANHEWFDDSKATNPAAAEAALNAFKQVIWICGGLRKDLDLSTLKNTVKEHVSHALVIGSDQDAYIELLQQSGVSYDVAGTVKKAVIMASKNKSMLPVLLSPAAASQDQFANYAERGKAFATAIAELSEVHS